ncbi:MAG TPA: molybdopterin-dependent oxidoreductase [Candidatus Acidoferrum sp.]|nr:molybdopterin-dependent oxidoreductase [Candidatus Acidoferrum sp.]
MPAGGSPSRRPLIVGFSAGVLALGANYLGHALFSIPLLPEQAGYLVLKILPLPVFETLLKTLGVLARPLLLVGSTVVIIGIYGLSAGILARFWPQRYVRILTALAVVVSAGIALLALAPTDSLVGVAIEVVLVAAPIFIVDRAIDEFTEPVAVSEDRRILVRNLFYGVVGIAVLGIAYASVRRFMTALAVREGTVARTEVTEVKDFYVVSKNLVGDPVVDAMAWRLQLPDRSLTYRDLLALPSQRLELTLECISNDVGGTLISNGVWEGPRVSDVLALTTVPAGAKWMLIQSADGYTESFPLGELTNDHLLATRLNGEALPPSHGYPARFIFPGHYGMKQPKWVTKIRFSVADQPGYWENNGWDERAIVKTMSRIDQPTDGASLGTGSVAFRGIAFAGARRISAVELSWDDGRSWNAAVLQPEFSPYSWRFWQLTTNLTAGEYRVRVRARDGEGTLQSSTPAPTLPNGADGYHTIAIETA